MKNRPISNLAMAQLRAWEAYAEEWDIYREDNHIRCMACDQSVACLTDRNGIAYRYSENDQRALLIAHIRQNHQDIEREVYEAARIANGGNSDIPDDGDNPTDSGLSD
jgi:hypothetical protein